MLNSMQRNISPEANYILKRSELFETKMSLIKIHVLSDKLLRQVVSFPLCFACLKILHKRFTHSITGNHVVKLDNETLTGRLLLYIDNDKNQVIKSGETIQILDVLKSNKKQKLKRLNTEELISTLTSISNDKDQYEFSRLLSLLDTEFCDRSRDLKTEVKLTILRAYMKVIPNKILQFNYYKMVLEELFNSVNELNKNDLIQLVFYIGLQKKRAKSQYMLNRCMKEITRRFMDSLTTEDLCIICNSTFKTSTKINNETFLNKVTSHLTDHLYLLNDPALCTTFIKTIRHNQCQSEDLLTTLSYAFFFNKSIKHYSFTGLCHILALYSDFLYYDEHLIKVFTGKCVELLKNNSYVSRSAYLSEHPRIKDVQRLLWSLYNLNYKHLNASDVKDVIIPTVMKSLEAGEFEDDYATLVNIVLYLWILNYRAYELISRALTKEHLQTLKASFPYKQRLNLLLSCIYFEDKALYRQLSSRPPEIANHDTRVELRKRPELERVLDSLKSIGIHGNVNKFEVGFQVPYLKIGGIVGYRKNIYKTIHVEVLDDYTSLKNTDNVPTGLMQLKLRILEKSDEGLVTIRANEINSMTNEELHSFLLDELDLVC